MSMLNFDATEIDTTAHEPVKPGVYEVVIAASETRPTRAGNGLGINLTFEILSNEAKGRKVWTWINFQHPNPEAQRIGREELARICKAVGVTKLDNTEQLHNLPMIATVAIDKDDPTRNVIKGYKAKAQGTGGSPRTPASAAGANNGDAFVPQTKSDVFAPPTAAATAPAAAQRTGETSLPRTPTNGNVSGAAPWAR